MPLNGSVLHEIIFHSYFGEKNTAIILVENKYLVFIEMEINIFPGKKFCYNIQNLDQFHSVKAQQDHNKSINFVRQLKFRKKKNRHQKCFAEFVFEIKRKSQKRPFHS